MVIKATAWIKSHNEVENSETKILMVQLRLKNQKGELRKSGQTSQKSKREFSWKTREQIVSRRT